jgi:hypothetical protein
MEMVQIRMMAAEAYPRSYVEDQNLEDVSLEGAFQKKEDLSLEALHCLASMVEVQIEELEAFRSLFQIHRMLH